MSSFTLNYPIASRLFENASPVYRRSGQLKRSSNNSKLNPMQTQAGPLLLQSLSDGSVDIDSVLAFPINWDSYLSRDTHLNQGNASQKEKIDSGLSWRSNSSNSSSSSNKHSVPALGSDVEKFGHTSPSPTSTNQILSSQVASVPPSRVLKSGKKRFNKPDSLFFVNTLNF